MRSHSNSAPHLTALDDFNGLCCLLGILLDVHIQAGSQIHPRNRFDPVFSRIFQLDPRRIR